MVSKYVLFATLHFLAVALLFKILIPILPLRIVNSCTNFVYYLTVIAVSRYTFQFTKKLYFNERIHPDNKSVLITGCDSGFGHLLAKKLYSKGFHVFACCQFPSGHGATELKKISSKRLQVVELDVTKDESVKNAVQFVEDNLRFDDLWAVVNNAGIHKGYSVDFSTMEDFQQVLDVNTLGPVRITKAFLHLLRKSKGRIVNMTSIYGREVQPMITAYTMSKFAMVAFNGCLRQEIAMWGIKVIAVEPELYRTGLTNHKLNKERMAATLEGLDESVKKAYGEKYVEALQKVMDIYVSVASPNVDIVVRDMERAVTMVHPNYHYKPRRNVAIRFFLYSYTIIPDHAKDIFCRTLMYFMNIHKPYTSF